VDIADTEDFKKNQCFLQDFAVLQEVIAFCTKGNVTNDHFSAEDL
jgi:hypothetical protein